MGRLLRTLTVHSLRELLRYKSFLLLILVLMVAERTAKKLLPAGLPAPATDLWREFGRQAAVFVFEEMPAVAADWLTDVRTLAAALAVFVLKQVVSMWPSSDMRRMHRRERRGFGLLASLAAIRWPQLVWDAFAVGANATIFAIWVLAAFGISRGCWLRLQSSGCLLLLAALIGVFAPLTLAGFSYSSKLAVLSRGSFAAKFGLFFKMYTDWRVLAATWLFFTFRLLLEVVFVAAVPAAVFLLVSHPAWRIALATVSAVPVYAFLKMASFKFFLEIYGKYPLVRREYRDYFLPDGPVGGADLPESRPTVH